MNANTREYNLMQSGRESKGMLLPALLTIVVAAASMSANTQAKAGTRRPRVTQRQSATPIQEITPRWTYRLPASSREEFRMFTYREPLNVITADTLVIQTEREPSTNNAKYMVHGLRRTDGRSIWQSEQLKSYDSDLSPLHSDHVVFFASAADYHEPAAEVYAVEATTGRVLWKHGAKQAAPQTMSTDELPRQLVGVMGSVTALSGVTAQTHIDSQKVELVRTETGNMLDLSLPADKQAFDEAIAANGTAVPVIPLYDTSNNFRDFSDQPHLLHLDVPRLTPISLAHIAPDWYNSGEILSGGMDVVGRAASRLIVLYVNEETDGVGSSGWPKYLVGMDDAGNKRWQFPRRVRRDDHTGEGIGSSQLYNPRLILDSNIVVAQDEERTLYGIRTSDGKQLWAQRLPKPPNEGWTLPGWTVYKQGIFALRRSPASSASRPQAMSDATDTRQLIYLDMQTGRTRDLMLLTFAHPAPNHELAFQLAADGNDLYIITPQEVRCYDCARLLAPKQTK